MLILRPWSDADTDILCAWYVADPTLWAATGYPIGATTQDLWWTAALRRADGAIAAVDLNGTLAAMLTLYPRLDATTAVVHLTMARAARGQAAAIVRVGLQEARRRGLTRLIALAPPLVSPAVHQRWLRSVGFTVKHYGEWHA